MIRSTLGLILAAGGLFAGTPIATVSSTGPVRVSGVEMAADSVAFWPLANGDVIEPLKTAAVLILRDHSRVTVSPGSKARVESNGDGVSVRVLTGSVDYNLKAPTSARFFEANRAVVNSATQGSIGSRFVTPAQADGGRRTGNGAGASGGSTVLPGSASPTV